MLQRQITLADDARKMHKAKSEQLLQSIEKQRREIVRLRTMIEKIESKKKGLLKKYHERIISSEAFQCEHEKANERATKYVAKISTLQARIQKLEAETGENLFIERFSRQAGLQELTRGIVEELISEIKVYAADHIEVVFSFADEYAQTAALIEKTK
jgi:DNA repair exonuclease SbcCD ATPase subunit